MVSSSEEELEESADGAGHVDTTEREMTRERRLAEGLSLSCSMSEAPDDEVRALVRKVSARLEEVDGAKEAELERDAERADMRDAEDLDEDGLAIAAAREKALMGDRSNCAGETSKIGGWDYGVEEAQEALRAFMEQINTRSNAANSYAHVGAVHVANAKGMTDAIMDTVDAGRPMCCAVGAGRRVAVGTDGGFIFLQRETKDKDTEVSCLRTANNFAGLSVTPSVTSLCFSERGEWLLAGYDDGGLALWDIKRNPTILKTIVGAHRTPVVALSMLPVLNASGAVDAISSEEGGLVIHHTFSPLGMGVIRVKSTSLGERTFVIAAQAMPRAHYTSAAEINAHENGIISPTWGETPSTFDAAKHVADGAGIVALCTMNAVLIMRLHPRAEVIAKIVRPPNTDMKVLPVMCWSPRNVDDIVVEEDVENCNLVVVWGSSVYVLAVKVEATRALQKMNSEHDKRSGNASQVLKSWSFDSNISVGAVAVAWLTQGVICVLSDRQKLHVCTPEGVNIEQMSLNEPPSSREITRTSHGQEVGSERLQCWNSTVTMHGVYLAILSPSRLRLGKLLGWRERVHAKKNANDWVGAFETLLQARDQKVAVWPILPKKFNDSELTKKKTLEILIELVPKFLIESLSARAPQVDNPVHQDAISRVVLGLFLAFDALELLYSPTIFGVFLHSKCESAFLERIVPHVMSDKLRALPVEVMQALVDHYAALGDADVIEKCVLHMDVESLDLNQVARLCKQHGMYSAFAHVFTRVLNDFTTPMETMFNASLTPVFGDKTRVRQLLLFMLESMRGKPFPTGQGELSKDLVARVHMEIMKFLFAPVALDSLVNTTHDMDRRVCIAWHAAMQLASNSKVLDLPPARLLYLLLAEPKASSTVLMEAIKDWDASESEILNLEEASSERMGSQIIAEAAVFAAKACGEADLPTSRSSLLIFTASIVGAGRAAVAQSVEEDLLEALVCASTVNDKVDREEAMVSILGRRIDEGTMPQNALNVLKLASEAHFVQAEAVIQMAHGDHISAIRAFAADRHYYTAATHYADVLLGKAEPGMLRAQQSNAGPAVGRAQPLDPKDIESFRKKLLEDMPAILHISAEVCARIAVAHFPEAQPEVLRALSPEPMLQFQYLRQVLEAAHESSESKYSPYDMTLTDLVCATNHLVTSEMNELYFRLMCQFEPQGVLRFLLSNAAHELDSEKCLSYCQEFHVNDAVAHLFEHSGRFEESLSIYLQNYSTTIRAMAQLFAPSGAQWAKTASTDSLMKGFTIEANDALNVAVSLCRRVAGQAERGDEMWWSCLDSIIRSLDELSGGAYARVRAVLHEHLEDALRVMLGRVDNAQILEMLVSRHGNRDISELRKLLSRVFSNCSLEREFLKAEGSSVAEEAEKKAEEDSKIRRRGRRGTQRVLK